VIPSLQFKIVQGLKLFSQYFKLNLSNFCFKFQCRTNKYSD